MPGSLAKAISSCLNQFLVLDVLLRVLEETGEAGATRRFRGRHPQTLPGIYRCTWLRGHRAQIPLQPAYCRFCPEEATRGQSRPKEAGIRAKPQRERRNAREFARNHGGSVETTAGASKGRPRPTARAVAAHNLSGPPQKRPEGRGGRNQTTAKGQTRPEQAKGGRNSRETTAGASKRKGIRAKPRRERRKFARIETKAPPHRVRRCGPQPRPEEARAGQKRPECARNHSGSVETQGNSRETTAGASKRNSRETTAGASKRRSRPTAVCAVAARHQFLYSQHKNPIVQALFGEQKQSQP